MQYNLDNMYIKIILGGCLALLIIESKSQSIAEPHKVEVTYNKTSSIIFPAIIKSVDKGSRDILAQKAKGVDNVLQLKAGKPNFAETNLTVITGDGILHQFTLNYSDKPASLSIDLSEDSLQNKMPLIFQTEMTETEMENYSTGIVQTKRTVRAVSESKYKISIALLGIYIKNDVMFYRFKIRNRSNINYTVDFLKFYIRDQTKIKRTASQEVVVKPIYVFGNDKEVKGKSETDVVYALEKFTIPESKHLDVEMFEYNGGRHFNLIIKNKTIVNARLLP
jgi:conjugative transposon TraN protein